MIPTGPGICYYWPANWLRHVGKQYYLAKLGTGVSYSPGFTLLEKLVWVQHPGHTTIICNHQKGAKETTKRPPTYGRTIEWRGCVRRGLGSSRCHGELGPPGQGSPNHCKRKRRQKITVDVGTLQTSKPGENHIVSGFVNSKTEKKKTTFKVMVSLGMGGGGLVEERVGLKELGSRDILTSEHGSSRASAVNSLQSQFRYRRLF